MGFTASRNWRVGRSGARVRNNLRAENGFLASARAQAERLLLPPSGVTEVLQSGKTKRPAVLRESGWPFRFVKLVPAQWVKGSVSGAGRISGPSGFAALAEPFFFFNDSATTEIYTLSLHDALPSLLKAAQASIAAARCGTAQPEPAPTPAPRSEEHTSELQSRGHLVCRLLLEKKKKNRPAPVSTEYAKHAVMV